MAAEDMLGVSNQKFVLRNCFYHGEVTYKVPNQFKRMECSELPGENQNQYAIRCMKLMVPDIVGINLSKYKIPKEMLEAIENTKDKKAKKKKSGALVDDLLAKKDELEKLGEYTTVDDKLTYYEFSDALLPSVFFDYIKGLELGEG